VFAIIPRTVDQKKYAARGSERARFYNEYYDCRRNIHTSRFKDLVSAVWLSSRRVASAKFHYRSPAINIINWAVPASYRSSQFRSSFFFPPLSTRSSPATLYEEDCRTNISSSVSPYPVLLPLPSSFFKLFAINLAKGQVWVDSSGDFNGGWCFAPIIGRWYRDGTPAFSLFIHFFFAIRFRSVFLHAGLVPRIPIILLNLRTSSSFAPSSFIYF